MSVCPLGKAGGKAEAATKSDDLIATITARESGQAAPCTRLVRRPAWEKPASALPGGAGMDDNPSHLAPRPLQTSGRTVYCLNDKGV